MKTIAILGSTGSIGTQTLMVARKLGVKVAALAAASNIDLLEKQAREFKPRIVAVRDERMAHELKAKLADMGIKVVGGEKGLIEAATVRNAEIVVTSIVGTAGLLPTVAAIRAGKHIALANKETLVAAGQAIMALAKEEGVRILPVDSEHSAIFQCLMGNNEKRVENLVITASGGPFRGKTREMLKDIKPEDALKHPNWNMGPKITIDSATMMNKGLEVIEAHWLFKMPVNRIKVVVHPQSVVHSAVEYIDGSMIAQMGCPDMRVPIQMAITWPDRAKSDFPRLDLIKMAQLTFEAPDMVNFPCLAHAFKAIEMGGTVPAVMNAANEIAVQAFLDGRIGFTTIPDVILEVMKSHTPIHKYKIEDVLECDAWAREQATQICSR